MDSNISLSNLSAFSFLFFPEYLSLGPSEVLVNIHKSHNPERGQLSGSQTHKCYQVSGEDKVVPKYDFPFHQSFFMELHLSCPHHVAYGKRAIFLQRPLDIGLGEEKNSCPSTLLVPQLGPCKIRLTKD